MRTCKRPGTQVWIGAVAYRLLIWAALLAGGAALGQDHYYGGENGTTPIPLTDSGSFTAAVVTPGSTAAAVSAALANGGVTIPPVDIYVIDNPSVAVIECAGQLAATRSAIRDEIGNGVFRGSLRVLANYAGHRPWVETDQVMALLAPGQNRAQVLAQYGLDLLRVLPLRDGWLVCRLQHPEDDSSIAIAGRMVEDGVASFAAPDFLLQIEKAAGRSLKPLFAETDPLFPNQWHLSNVGQGGGVPGADVGAPGAWDVSRGNPDAVICIYDDAIDIDHEDIDVLLSDGRPKVLTSYDVSDQSSNCRPAPGSGASQAHGTSVTGVATAMGANGLGGTGIAPDCQLIGISWARATNVVSQVTDGFLFARDQGAWVTNNSWGLGVMYGDQPALDQSIADLYFVGRGGQGSIVLAAAGNGNSGSENDNGLADINYPSSHPQVWSVGASTNFDLHSDYSDTGTAVKFVAPSNGGSLGITTTDVMGSDGYDSGNYNADFGGTSSACPLASGVTALVFGLLPFMPQNQILGILISTTDKIGNLPYNGPFGGRNNVYGYGRLDADAALNMALNFLGTTVTLQVTTVNGAQGKPLDKTTPVPVSFIDPLDNPRTAYVYDGISVDIFVKDGTAVTFPSQVDASATSRYVSLNAPSQVITGPVTLSADYYHQLRRDFRVAVQAGADVKPILWSDNNTVDLKVVQTRAGGPPIEVNAQVPPGPNQDFERIWADAGSTYEFGLQSSASGPDERWIALTQKVGTFALNDPAPTATFFHQSRPRVRLIGTNSQSVVDTERRTLFGVEAGVSDVFGTFNEFCDNGSRLGFTERTRSLGDEPVRGTNDAHEFQIATGLDTSITYTAEAYSSQSFVQVLTPRVAANGHSTATVEVYVRDSLGNPLDEPVAAERVGLIPNPTDGVQIITPTGESDENGKLVFQVSRNLPGTVKLTGTVDGEAIPADTGDPPSDEVEFLRTMTVPLPVPGTYFVTFPIVPDGDVVGAQTRLATPGDPANSLEQIRSFDVVPQPAQMARLIDGTETYVLFSSLEKLQPTNPNYSRFRELFRIEPGRGFFLRTNQPGSAELVGEWATGTEYAFPMDAAGFHQLGNPMADQPLFWSLADFDVWENGQLVGALDDLIAAVSANPAAPRYVDPFAWAFTGTEYEQVTDPTVPGTEGLKSKLAVFEGFFWRSHRPGLELRYYPGRGRAASPAPITPSNFGIQLQAAVGEHRAVAIVGSYGRGLRTTTTPPSPDGAEAVRLEVINADGSRAAGDWLSGAVTRPTDWTVAVTTPAGGSEVTLSWPHLNRQLPRGYRVRLTDQTSGKSILLNSSSSYVFTTSRAGESRPFQVTVVPRSEEGLRVLSFEPGVSRGRTMTFGVQLSGEADLRLLVTSPSGRTIATTATTRAVGSASLVWNGLDQAGRPVPQGLYHVTLVAVSPDGEVRRVLRVIRIR